MPTTTRGYRYPAAGDAPNVPLDIQELASDVDTDVTSVVAMVTTGFAEKAPPIGAEVAYAGTGDPAGGNWLLEDGRLVSKTTYAAFFTAVGHSYNAGVDPGGNMMRIPDGRGRVKVGADNMGTAQGAAGRLPNSNRARGQNGGEERHTLTPTETAIRSHEHDMTTNNHGGGPPSLIDIGGGRMGARGSTTGGGSDAGLTMRTDGAFAFSIGVGDVNGGEVDGAAHNVLQPYEVSNWIVRVL